MSLSDCLRSRYLLFRGLTDAGLDAARAATITDIVHGPEPAEDEDDTDDFEELAEDLEPDRAEEEERPEPEPFEPSAADWDDFHRWCEMSDLADLRRRYSDADLEAAGLAIG